MTKNVIAILLAGGSGSRMQNPIPKQYLLLHDKPLVLYSFEILLSHPCINEIVIVCSPEFQSYFSHHTHKRIHFAPPGQRRQDSVFNGLQKIQAENSLILTHDAARPMISHALIQKAIEGAQEIGAATVAIPLKFTIKEVDANCLVQNTPDRSNLWEIQTPQTIRKSLLLQGFEIAHKHNLTVTDDVSLVELFKHPVKIIQGCHTNMKVTTPEDLIMVKHLLSSQTPLTTHAKRL